MGLPLLFRAGELISSRAAEKRMRCWQASMISAPRAWGDGLASACDVADVT